MGSAASRRNPTAPGRAATRWPCARAVGTPGGRQQRPKNVPTRPPSRGRRGPAPSPLRQDCRRPSRCHPTVPPPQSNTQCKRRVQGVRVDVTQHRPPARGARIGARRARTGRPPHVPAPPARTAIRGTRRWCRRRHRPPAARWAARAVGLRPPPTATGRAAAGTKSIAAARVGAEQRSATAPPRRLLFARGRASVATDPTGNLRDIQ